MNAATQNAQILAWLRDGKAITPLGALTMFGCFRLSARIHDLRRQGHPIYTITVKHDGKRFAMYGLRQAGGQP